MATTSITERLAPYSEPPHHYATKDGRRIPLKAVAVLISQSIAARVRKEFAAAGEQIEPPKYSVKDASGGLQWFPHSVNDKGNSLDVKDNPEETAQNWRMWQAHQDALTRMRSQANEESMQAVLFLGVECDNPTEDWVATMRFVGADIPDDPREQRMRYITLELLKDPEDWTGCMLAIQRLSGVLSEEQVLDARDSFRRAMGRAGRDAISGITAEEESLVGGESEPVAVADSGEVVVATI